MRPIGLADPRIQLGAGTAVLLLTAVAVLAGRLLTGGTSAWALSDVIKRLVRRPRPAVLPARPR